MAFSLVWAGGAYIATQCIWDPSMAIEEMPPVVPPFAQCKEWMDA
jgi:hypothetical protein